MPHIHAARPTSIRAPSTEVRAAASLHAVTHSTGLVVTDADLPSPSFRVGADGTVTAVAGWGFAGPTAALVDSLRNPPPNPAAVHTVAVAGDGPAVRAGLRQLVEEHLERYAGCQVWLTPGASRVLTAWVAAGCPVPVEAQTVRSNVVPAVPTGGLFVDVVAGTVEGAVYHS